MNIVDKAIELALTAHFGIANKHDGEPYVLHLQRVANTVRDQGYSELVVASAWLHDTLEDTELEVPDLYDAGMPIEVIDAVILLTKTKSGENKKYYERLAKNPIARAVKLADIQDNFRRNHQIEDDETRLRMAKKYSMGLDIVTAG